ncbi:minor capsid protein [Bacillus phage Carmen17]|uniref:Minor capsid protein n=1 Tax=Bacillus phage Carmen17 TaxID=2072797 RepID=A0A2I7QIP1_9CAUD|nr:head-tail adaptor [Bacillus phage Carmen17]AUR81269.1 minor capsid protein [Bacillus phage Carmen17]
MARQIPKHLLIHTVQYLEYAGTSGGWGGSGGSYLPSVDYKHVRVEPSTQMISDGNGNSMVARGVMFIDMVNSDYNNKIPTEKSKIIHNGIEFVVKQVDYLYTRELHHVEVYLA